MNDVKQNYCCYSLTQKLRMVFCNFSYYFWVGIVSKTETSVIGNEFFVFYTFKMPSTFLLPPALPLLRRPCLSILFCDFLLIGRSGLSHVTITCLGVRCTSSMGPWYWRMWGLSWHLKYVKVSFAKNQVSKNQINAACVSSLTIGKII